MQDSHELMFIIQEGGSYQPFKITSLIPKSHIHLYVKLHLRNYYDHIFHDHKYLGSPNGTYCLKPTRHHDVFIKKIYYYLLNHQMVIHREYIIILGSYP